MLAIPVIFGFVAVLFLVSIKIIDLIFDIRSKFRPKFIRFIFTALSLLLWFSFGAFATLFISYSLIKLPQFLLVDERAIVETVSLETKDCQFLQDYIYQVENQIYQVENHRYIEETFTSSKIKSKYIEGAEILNSKAEEYLNLNISPNQSYTRQLAQTLLDKAELFQKRIEISEDSKNLQKLRDLIGKMDRVTQKRKNLVNTIERQCNNL